MTDTNAASQMHINLFEAGKLDSKQVERDLLDLVQTE
jgi:hypothetical protein